MRGTQKSLLIAFLVTFLSTFIGVGAGAIAGYFGGWIDTLLMRFVDLLLTVPLIAVAGALSGKVKGDNNWWIMALILAAVSWLTLARLVRAEFLSLREKEFVEAAKAIGATDRRVIVKHMLPNAMGTIIVSATLTIGGAILAETALSFVGLGVRSPDTSLGLIVSENQTAFSTRPWLFWYPGLFILLIALSVNFIGDGLRDAFDPKQTRVRA
jgi:peptide/nickel transport system permease protein